MAAITAALIKQVREETGAGMMDVKKALTEAEGDVARAKEIIRAKGIQAAGKREGRKAQEGPHVEVYAHKKSAEMPPSIVAMIATDEAGAAVAHEAALQISAMGAQWLTREDVPADVVESERRVATEKSLAEGKPEKIVPKIVEGRLNAFYKENVLLEQSYVKDPSKTVGDLFKEVGGAAVAFARVEVGKGEAE